MRDVHFERTNIGKHCIAVLMPDTTPVHCAPHCAVSKTGDFWKTKIDKTLAKNIIEAAQSEWAVPIAFVPKKIKTFQSCVDNCKLQT